MLYIVVNKLRSSSIIFIHNSSSSSPPSSMSPFTNFPKSSGSIRPRYTAQSKKRQKGNKNYTPIYCLCIFYENPPEIYQSSFKTITLLKTYIPDTKSSSFNDFFIISVNIFTTRPSHLGSSFPPSCRLKNMENSFVFRQSIVCLDR